MEGGRVAHLSEPSRGCVESRRTRGAAAADHLCLLRILLAGIAALISAFSLAAADGKAPNLAEASAQYEASHPNVRKAVGSVKPPILVTRVDPRFPDDVMKKKRELTPIILEVVISETGAVTDPVVLSTDNSDLHRYALAAIRQWVYKPARDDSKPVSVFMMISFTLHGSRS
jgi:TonB family protein